MLLEGVADATHFFLFILPIATLLILGAIGIIGLVQIMDHIYYKGYTATKITVHIKIYAGIVSIGAFCIFMIFSNSFSISPILVIFLLPVGCGLHLISITKPENPTKPEQSIFNDV